MSTRPGMVSIKSLENSFMDSLKACADASCVNEEMNQVYRSVEDIQMFNIYKIWYERECASTSGRVVKAGLDRFKKYLNTVHNKFGVQSNSNIARGLTVRHLSRWIWSMHA